MTVSKLPERPLSAQSRKREIPHDNFTCRIDFLPGLEFLAKLRVAIQILCDEQKAWEHNTVAFVQPDNKNEQERETVAFFKLQDSKNEWEHETVAFFQASRRAGTQD